MYNIQFAYYVMLLCNVSEIRYTNVVSIQKQLQKLKKLKTKKMYSNSFPRKTGS